MIEPVAASSDRFQPPRAVLAVVSRPDDHDLLQDAIAFARHWDAKVSVLAVVEPPNHIELIARAAGTDEGAIQDGLVEAARRDATEALARLDDGETVPLTVRVGKPFLEIVRHVKAEGIDLVLKSADTLEGLERLLFASTDQHLLRKCPCPVWLRQPGRTRPPARVMAAVDVDETGAGEPETLSALNRRILDAAVQAAAGPGAMIHVVHAWDTVGEGLVRAWAQDPAAETFGRDMQAMHARALDRVIEETAARIGPDLARRVRLSPHEVRGQAREAIPALIHRLQVDLLVIGTVARTGLPGFIIGNTAEDVLNSVTCSVLTVKPPRFISPLDAA